ncbi:MAG: hypothetical protein WCO60_19340 [Verrucomicrobiota bacterium]
MIRTSQLEGKTGAPGGLALPVQCWGEDTKTLAVRFEFKNGDFFVFPYVNLLSVEYRAADPGDEVKVRYSSHEVRVLGEGLRRLALSFQRLQVEWGSEAARRYERASAVDAGLVLGIEVRETG